MNRRPDPATLQAALEAAAAPVAAYVARTPPGNRHADACETLLHAVADYVEATAPVPAPDWESLAYRLFARFTAYTPRPTSLVARVAAHLAQPHLLARAEQPLPQRQFLATGTSHNLGLPDYLTAYLQTLPR